ncbi:MAG: TadE family protein [Hyalangium sp.]|uniref:TadE family protein n=1 Tax=Hyalangium sp. TaxID=2028555 RepID=UPI00389AD603
MSHASARGQATVELALGALVFVTILVFGIHFAELGMMKLRVQQAATAALWDTTGLRMHRFTSTSNAGAHFRSADEVRDRDGRLPGPRAEARFKDFEGLEEGGRSTFTQVMTRGSQLNVQCSPTRVSPIPTGGPFKHLRAAYAPAQDGGRDVDGMQCSADARIEVWGMPTRFLEDSRKGFFQVNHVLQPRLKVCAFGRARGGRCLGSVSIALDDWGLSGSDKDYGEELAECREDCQFEGKGNQAYRLTVKRLYDEYNTYETQDFSIPFFIRSLFTQDPAVPELANVPVDERAFRMVFVGEAGSEINGRKEPFAFKTREQNTTQAFDFGWATTPYADAYKDAYQRRGECFLGAPCDQSFFEKEAW